MPETVSDYTDPAAVTPFGLGLHHLQIAMPPGTEAATRTFYLGALGLSEVRKPPALAVRGGFWARADRLELHLGIEADFQPQRKAHPGIFVADLDALAARLIAHGIAIRWDDEFPGFRRFYTTDNNGNRLEFLTPAADR